MPFSPAGDADSEMAEWTLRRYAEEAIVGGASLENLVEPARALVFVNLLDAETAATVLDSYGRAQRLRNREVPWHGTISRRRSAPTLGDRRIRVCLAPVEVALGTLAPDYVTVTPTTVEIVGALTARDAAAATGHPHGRPPQLKIVVGSAAAVSAHFSGSGDHRGWRGEFTAEGQFDPDTMRIEVEGSPLELGVAATPARMEVEVADPLAPPAERARRYLLHQLEVVEADSHDEVAAALTTLIECGALNRDDPTVDEVKAAISGQRVPQRRTHRPHHHHRGTDQMIVIDARPPEFDGVTVTVSHLRLAGDGIEVAVAAHGAATSRAGIGPIDTARLAFTLIDEHGESRRGWLRESSGGDDSFHGIVRFDEPFASASGTVQLVIAAERARAVIAVPISAGRGR